MAAAVSGVGGRYGVIHGRFWGNRRPEYKKEKRRLKAGSINKKSSILLFLYPLAFVPFNSRFYIPLHFYSLSLIALV